jgi:macrolide transport system ATP-binding/permease protein
VVVELSTAMILLAAAGLFGESLDHLLRVPLGINPDHLVTIDIEAPSAGYDTDARAIALARLVTAQTEGLPGVTSVGIAENGVPLSGNSKTSWFRVLGRPWHGEDDEVTSGTLAPPISTRSAPACCGAARSRRPRIN